MESLPAVENIDHGAVHTAPGLTLYHCLVVTCLLRVEGPASELSGVVSILPDNSCTIAGCWGGGILGF